MRFKTDLQKGQVIHALAVVQAEPSVEKLLKALLGRTFIASDLGHGHGPDPKRPRGL